MPLNPIQVPQRSQLFGNPTSIHRIIPLEICRTLVQRGHGGTCTWQQGTQGESMNSRMHELGLAGGEATTFTRLADRQQLAQEGGQCVVHGSFLASHAFAKVLASPRVFAEAPKRCPSLARLSSSSLLFSSPPFLFIAPSFSLSPPNSFLRQLAQYTTPFSSGTKGTFTSTLSFYRCIDSQFLPTGANPCFFPYHHSFYCVLGFLPHLHDSPLARESGCLLATKGMHPYTHLLLVLSSSPPIATRSSP